MKLLSGYTKEEKSWMMYDWANSAHSVIVVTILPIFFNAIATSQGMNTWGYATSIAMLVVAVLAPVLGAFGDFKGWRKRLFTGFMLLGVLSCAALAVTPLLYGADKPPAFIESLAFGILILYILSTIGFAGANLYYDSFLNDVTSDERMDKVSTMGFGLGYIGGSTIPLLIFLIMNLILGNEYLLVCMSVAFGLTAVWWLVFSFPLLKNVQQKSYMEKKPHAVRKSLAKLFTTGREIFRNKALFVFLLSYFFYIDGVNTIIHMSTSYGDTLGLGQTSMLLALLLVQLLGLPFALLYIRLSARFGARAMVGVGICIYCFITVFAFFISETWHFWLLAVLVATSQGGIQALSRSMYGKMIPDKNRSGEFFGFYDIFGKFSAIMGPALVALVSGLAADGIRMGNAHMSEEMIEAAAAPWGVLSLLLIFAVACVCYFVILPRYLKKKEGQNHA